MDLGEDARGAEGMAENTFSSCEVLDLADNGQAKHPRQAKGRFLLKGSDF